MNRSATFVAMAAGVASAIASARASTTMQLQVSPALAEDWHSSINVTAGASVDVRVVVSYTGTATPLGLSSVIFQPTVSNWSPGLDAMTPLINGGAGGQVTDPIGAVQDLPGQYGRIIPYAQFGIPATNALIGHVNTVAGVSYLRIAQAQVTSWIGDSGNTTAGSGVNMRQYNIDQDGRTTSDPAFSTALTNVVLLKFNITLDSSDFSTRTVLVDSPLAGIYSGTTGHPYVGWYVSSSELTGSLRDQPTIQTASILVNVPGPGTIPALVGAGLIAGRRRRPKRDPRA